MRSVVSYPERGAGGNNMYRGNCSPRLLEDLFGFYKPKKVFDPMCGSGTTRDVCLKLGIHHDVLDLNPEFGGWDALRDEIPGVYDMIFFHPPYSNIIKYSGHMWGNPDPRDLSQIPLEQYSQFIKKLSLIQKRLFTSLSRGGRLAILVGDVKKNGKLYSIQRDMAWLGTPEQVVIKAQHNCWSDHVDYSGKFIPICHEYLLIFRKDSCYILPCTISVSSEINWKTEEKLSWRTAVRLALEGLGGKADLPKLYKEIKSFAATKKHSDPEAKVRQILQTKPEFYSVDRGIWRLKQVA
ncbi:hypothetical protein [Bacteroides sp.]|uniref:hypothetical protein n=1 Tax=Bacteroides sp. TaxID=29523 RepID=UPI00261D6EA7|nr:hypothetical protein [Bacteroides sp.]MDD3040428.1 hypothetical protein [Bacteroides sp.]